MWQTHTYISTHTVRKHPFESIVWVREPGDGLGPLGTGHVSKSLPKACLLKVPISLIQKAQAPSLFLHSFNKHAL